jgi:hypothetical protein
MDLAKHELLFSKTRIAGYISACKGDTNKGLKLYKYNIQASQALYPVISVLEVSLRNSIDSELSKHYSDANWLMTQRADFSENPFLVYKDKHGNDQSDLFFREKIEKAENKLRYKGSPLNHVKLLAELTFGFWIKFFDTSPIKILKGAPLQVFKNKPGVKLAKVHSHLNSIVALRNRISHSEPICFDRLGKLCLDTMLQYQFDIEDALRWLDSDLSVWAEKLNFYKPVVIRISGL